MKLIPSLILTAALASSAFAGSEVSYSAKSTPQLAPVETGCACFGPGGAIGIFGSAILPDGDQDDAAGGGVLAEYFFTPHIGFQGSYAAYATGSEHHEFDGALVLRFPITSICLAPYVLGGAGYSVNSDDKVNYFVGGGLEYRIADADCLAIFADGAYHFAEDNSDEDYTIVRLGVKFPF